MLVRITPPGRRSRVFDVPGVQRSWDINGGCAAASVPLVLTEEDRERILLAKVETFDWTGIVWRMPVEGKPLQCAGQGMALAMQSGKALYAKTDFLRDMEDYNGTNAGIYRRSNSGGKLTVSQQVGTTSTAGDTAGYYYHGDTILISLSFACKVNMADRGFYITSLDVNGAVVSTDYAQNVVGTYTGQSVTFPANTYGFIVHLTEQAGWTATIVAEVEFFGGTLYGVSYAVTPYNVIDANLDLLPTWALPAGDAYRRWIASPTLDITSLDFPDPKTTLKDRIAAVVEMTDHHFGFYPEWVGHARVGVPHFQPIETTPTLSLDVGSGLSGTAVDSLGSDFIVRHPDDLGRTTFETVTDADATHYLNVIGYDRDVIVDAPWTTSATLATAVGTQAAASSDVRGAEGSVAVKRCRLANGRAAPFHMIRPGKLAYTYVDGKRRQLLITGCDAIDDDWRVTFGTSPTNLRALTAKATGRGNY
jgi:hypothetical protein